MIEGDKDKKYIDITIKKYNICTRVVIWTLLIPALLFINSLLMEDRSYFRIRSFIIFLIALNIFIVIVKRLDNNILRLLDNRNNIKLYIKIIEEMEQKFKGRVNNIFKLNAVLSYIAETEYEKANSLLKNIEMKSKKFKGEEVFYEYLECLISISSGEQEDRSNFDRWREKKRQKEHIEKYVNSLDRYKAAFQSNNMEDQKEILLMQRTKFYGNKTNLKNIVILIVFVCLIPHVKYYDTPQEAISKEQMKNIIFEKENADCYVMIYLENNDFCYTKLKVINNGTKKYQWMREGRLSINKNYLDKRIDNQENREFYLSSDIQTRVFFEESVWKKFKIKRGVLCGITPFEEVKNLKVKGEWPDTITEVIVEGKKYYVWWFEHYDYSEPADIDTSKWIKFEEK